jgi:hypothetical protein
MLYFDNHPHIHYGTIRQQIWSVLHFPLQLAIVGIVEGSQQITLARYVLKSWTKVLNDVSYYCAELGYEGDQLVNVLNETISYFQLDSKVETLGQLYTIDEDLIAVGKEKGMCIPENFVGDKYPESLIKLEFDVLGGIFQSLGMKLPEGKDPASVAVRSWKVVYIYYWSSILVLLACLMVCLCLIRKGNKADIFDWFAMIARGLGIAVSVAFLAVAAKFEPLYNLLYTPAIVPTVSSMFFGILLIDYIGRWLSNRRLHRSGVVVDDDHGHVDEHKSHGFADPKKEAHVAIHESDYPMVHNPSVDSQHSYSPHYVPGGYMPVDSGHSGA